MDQAKATKKRLKRMRKALKPSNPCYAAHLDEEISNPNYLPHIHVRMTDEAGRPIQIWWEKSEAKYPGWYLDYKSRQWHYYGPRG